MIGSNLGMSYLKSRTASITKCFSGNAQPERQDSGSDLVCSNCRQIGRTFEDSKIQEISVMVVVFQTHLSPLGPCVQNVEFQRSGVPASDER